MCIRDRIAAGVTFLVAYPLLYWAGATPSAISGQGSLLGAMAVFGAVLPAALLLIFACVTGNAGNMFPVSYTHLSGSTL